MLKGAKLERPVIDARILALVSVLLALMSAVLAWAWSHERDRAACWKTAAEFQLLDEGACDGPSDA